MLGDAKKQILFRSSKGDEVDRFVHGRMDERLLDGLSLYKRTGYHVVGLFHVSKDVWSNG